MASSHPVAGVDAALQKIEAGEGEGLPVFSAAAADQAVVEAQLRPRRMAGAGLCPPAPARLFFFPLGRKKNSAHVVGERRRTLNWKQRFNIIVGMARGLAYLHQEFHVCIIHRDIKSSNVLLDDDFQPKIADFGLARLLPDDHSHLSTKFARTLGYTAPEYAILGQLSEKVDTYSFGVVILEIISGRKSNDTRLEPETQYLLESVLNLVPKEQEGEKFNDALAHVRRCVGGGTETHNAVSDSDIEVVADSVSVNLRCPMTGSRIKVAGRFKHCVHMGCFDLEAFVELNQRSRKWQCPICLKNYSLDNLIIDPYFNRITTLVTSSEDSEAEAAAFKVWQLKHLLWKNLFVWERPQQWR